jgi:hypothetical protein
LHLPTPDEDWIRSSVPVLCCASCCSPVRAWTATQPLEATPADASPAAARTRCSRRTRTASSLPSDRIYFTLTDHEWYARGEPLLHGNAAYQPAGMPVSASLSEMTHVGEYQGVDYYVREATSGLSLYVPVFEGYWQPFRADTARRN